MSKARRLNVSNQIDAKQRFNVGNILKTWHIEISGTKIVIELFSYLSRTSALSKQKSSQERIPMIVLQATMLQRTPST